MKNSTLKIFLLLFLGFVAFRANSQEWNISSASFSSLVTITSTTTVEGLTIYATADAAVTVDANSKSLDGMNFTSRLKLGGSGTFDGDRNPVSRILSIAVSGSTTIKIAGMSSSSSADRQLMIVTKTDTIGTFAALGASISSGEFTYTGGPTTIYLYSPSSGVNIYYIKATPVVANDPQEWNISADAFKSLGTITADTTVNGLTIFATADAAVTVDANSKSLNGMDFTSRLKLGGSGTFDAERNPVSRILAFNVGGNTTITVVGMSSSSSADRQLMIVTKTDTIGTFAALGASISSGEFTYTGDPTTIYLYSPSSGVNLYYIKTTPLSTNVKTTIKVPEMTIYPNPASGKVFINVRQVSIIGIYSMTGQLVKQQLLNPSQNSIDISDLHSGLYFVRMMNAEGKTQKLIVQ